MIPISYKMYSEVFKSIIISVPHNKKSPDPRVISTGPRVSRGRKVRSRSNEARYLTAAASVQWRESSVDARLQHRHPSTGTSRPESPFKKKRPLQPQPPSPPCTCDDEEDEVLEGEGRDSKMSRATTRTAQSPFGKTILLSKFFLKSLGFFWFLIFFRYFGFFLVAFLFFLYSFGFLLYPFKFFSFEI